MTEIISAAVLLILIMDPLGNLPIFMSVLKHTEPKRRRAIMIRELLIALLVMFIFLFAGEKILAFGVAGIPEVDMGIHHARQDMPAFGVNHGFSVRFGKIKAQPDNFSVINRNMPLKKSVIRIVKSVFDDELQFFCHFRLRCFV